MQSNPLPTSTQRTGATAAFAITGLLWTLWLAGILAVITNGRLYLLLWTGSAVVLWFLVLEQLRDPKHSALAVAVKWWVFTLLGPFALAYVLISPPSLDLAAHLLRAKLFSVDGFVGAIWTTERVKQTAVIRISLLVPLSRQLRAELTDEADRLIRFIEPDARTFEIHFAD